MILKGHVRNHAQLEVCIAECYIAKCNSFCNSFIDQPIRVDHQGHDQDLINDGNIDGHVEHQLHRMMIC